MGSKSKSKSSSSSSQADNRIVADSSSVATAGGTIYNAGADKIAAMHSEVIQHVNDTQADGIKAMAQMGAGNVVTAADMVNRSASNVSQSIDYMLDTVGKVSTELIKTSAAQGDGSRAIAQAAMAAYQPQDNKQSDTVLKLGYAAAAAVVGFALLRKR